MALTLGIIGLQKSGKTTVFNALTRSAAQTSAYASGSNEPNVAMVKVPDERLTALVDIFHPKRIVQADVQYTDVAGISKGAARGESFSRAFISYISTVEALVHVVRAFASDEVPHPDDSVDPLRDIATVELELAFSDLAIIEKRLLRLKETIAKTKAGPERETFERELEVLQYVQPQLEAGQPIRALGLNEEQERLLRNYGFLTAKPMLILLNISENQLDAADALIAKVQAKYAMPNTAVAAIAGKLEQDLAQLDEAEAAEFMADLGLKESGLSRIIKQSYQLMGLISFLTAGPDENRAWTIRRGTNAQKAAGVIHSDLERGFIRAEVVHYDDIMAAGSMVEAKKRGTVRSEGKTYVVKDGDIIEVRFNV